MISAIIFSKNRPLQLNALLSSIKENCDVFERVYVQWTGNIEPDFLANPSLTYLYEDFSGIGFKKTLLTILKSDNNSHTAFFVDDNIFHRKLDGFEKVDLFSALSTDQADIFSLRLGKNITIKSHFDYKGSLDGNIYKREDLLSLADHEFSNPNKLEIVLCKLMKNKTMAWFDRSKVIGVPANKVSETSTCSDMGVSVELLHKMHEAGIEMDWESMDLNFWNVHKAEPLRFRLIK